MISDEVQAHIILPMAEIEAFCRKWQIVEMALFGSVLRDDFGPESDVDVLVTYAPDAPHTLNGYLAMFDELETLFGRKVDIVNRETVTRSRNIIRRREILNSARTIYAA